MADDTTAPVAEPDASADPVEPAAAEPEKAEPETITLPKAEADALRRRVAEGEKAQRKYEADRKKADEARQAEEGKWRELAEQRNQELAQAHERAGKLERDQRISRIAQRMKFLDPTDVIGRISAEDGQDDTLTEAALARISEVSPHLIAKEQAAVPEIGQVLTPSATTAADGAPKAPPGKAPLRSMADVDQLTQDEMVARMDEIDWVLAQQK